MIPSRNHSQKPLGGLLFAKEMLRNFTAVGAILPTSAYTAKQMAQQVDDNQTGYVVELGAGTGSITAALLERLSDAKRLIVIEQSKELAQHLKKRFPQLHVINGDARNLQALLGEKSKQVTTIVSALPFTVMPKDTAREVYQQINAVLQHHGRLIQITYNWRKHYTYISDQFKWVNSKYVWRNVPPARIHVLEHVN